MWVQQEEAAITGQSGGGFLYLLEADEAKPNPRYWFFERAQETKSWFFERTHALSVNSLRQYFLVPDPSVYPAVGLGPVMLVT